MYLDESRPTGWHFITVYVVRFNWMHLCHKQIVYVLVLWYAYQMLLLAKLKKTQCKLEF
jgi:hypothetical protein